jgi:hypothetical protein
MGKREEIFLSRETHRSFSLLSAHAGAWKVYKSGKLFHSILQHYQTSTLTFRSRGRSGLEAEKTALD